MLQNGERVKIQDQPLQILISLLKKPGELVPREALWKQLWPEKNAEDSDRSLRVAATKLRQALGDNPSEPRLIETIPRKGYQFIGQVRSVEPAVVSLEAGLLTTEEIITPDADLEIRQETRVFRGIPGLRWICLSVLILIGISVWGIRRYLVRPKPGASIVVSGIANTSSDPKFDEVLSPVLRAKIEESPYLNLGSEEGFRRLLGDTDKIDLKEKLKVCRNAHAEEMVGGQLSAETTGYRLELAVWRCLDGQVLATESGKARSQPELLPTLDAMTERMRRSLGEPADSLMKFNVPADRALTGSLAALKAFTEGERKHVSGMDTSAIEDYRLAVALDSQFAMAYARLGTVYSDVGEAETGNQYYRKAFELRDRTTERGRFYITSHYFMSTGEIKLAENTLRLWREIYPRDAVAANNLAALYDILGDPKKELEQAQASVQLDPGFGYSYINLLWANLRTGNYAALNRACAATATDRNASMAVRTACFQGAFAQGDSAAMKMQADGAKGDPEESLMIATEAWVAVCKGQITEGMRLFEAAQESAKLHHLEEFAAEIGADQAMLQADLNQMVQAKQKAGETLALSPKSATVQAFAALVFAKAGDAATANRLAQQASTQAPVDTILQDVVLPSVRAALWMHEGKPAMAVHELEAARPYDFCSAMELAPAYYRGLAYLQNGNLDKAAFEFERVTSQRVNLPASAYLALAQFELGRAKMLDGKTAEAKQAFDEVAKQWSEADRDFSLFTQLKAYRLELTRADSKE